MQNDRRVRKEYVREYLTNHPCIDCGNEDIRVLEFDHVLPEKKEMTIAYAIGHVGMERLKQEIDKCEVRCANCHTRRHFNEG